MPLKIGGFTPSALLPAETTPPQQAAAPQTPTSPEAKAEKTMLQKFVAPFFSFLRLHSAFLAT